tara:strand:+ start:6953 stop:7858 length:906 start_codon:yes stop_codon:yes gene_type:complete
MRIAVYPQTFLKELQHVVEAITKGFGGEDDYISVTDDPKATCDVAVISGGLKYGLDGGTKIVGSASRIRQPIIKNQKNIIYMESAVFRENIPHPFKHYRFAWNGFMADDGYFCNENSPPDRFQMFQKYQGIVVHPWQTLQAREKDNKHILITLQKEDDSSLRGLNVNKWAAETVANIKRETDRKIIVRPHPLNKRPYWPLANVEWSQKTDLIDDLKNCHAVVTYSSLSGIEAITRGIPVFPRSAANFAWSFGNHFLTRIEDPQYFKREQRLYNLGYTSWDTEEVGDGTLWKHLNKRTVSVR